MSSDSGEMMMKLLLSLAMNYCCLIKIISILDFRFCYWVIMGNTCGLRTKKVMGGAQIFYDTTGGG